MAGTRSQQVLVVSPDLHASSRLMVWGAKTWDASKYLLRASLQESSVDATAWSKQAVGAHLAV